MLELFPAIVSLLGSLVPANLQEGAFLELYSAPADAGPAREVFRVFVDEIPAAAQFHVLSRRQPLAATAVEGHEVIKLDDPRVHLPTALGVGESWVLTPASIGRSTLLVSGAKESTSFTSFFPAAEQVERAGHWGVLASEDAGTLLFLRGGHVPDDPAVLAVVSAAEGERMELKLPALPRVRISADGQLVVVQVHDRIEVFAGAERLTAITARSGNIHLSRAGTWLAVELDEGIELHGLDGRGAVTLPTSEPVMALAFEGDQVLIAERSLARLYDLGSGAPAQPVLSVPAAQGHRFSSAALAPRVDGGGSWIALGELGIRVPRLLVPDAPPPVAGVRVRILGPDGVEREAWSFDVSGWRANTPSLQWGAGRLIASTETLVFASMELYP